MEEFHQSNHESNLIIIKLSLWHTAPSGGQTTQLLLTLVVLKLANPIIFIISISSSVFPSMSSAVERIRKYIYHQSGDNVEESTVRIHFIPEIWMGFATFSLASLRSSSRLSFCLIGELEEER